MQPATEHFGGRFCVVGEQEGKNMARLTYLTLQMLIVGNSPYSALLRSTWYSVGGALELAPIGGQLFAHGISQRD